MCKILLYHKHCPNAKQTNTSFPKDIIDPYIFHCLCKSIANLSFVVLTVAIQWAPLGLYIFGVTQICVHFIIKGERKRICEEITDVVGLGCVWLINAKKYCVTIILP